MHKFMIAGFIVIGLAFVGYFTFYPVYCHLYNAAHDAEIFLMGVSVAKKVQFYEKIALIGGLYILAVGLLMLPFILGFVRYVKHGSCNGKLAGFLRVYRWIIGLICAYEIIVEGIVGAARAGIEHAHIWLMLAIGCLGALFCCIGTKGILD